MPDPARFRKQLLRWYDAAHRDLPWRRTLDPWRILVSEIMLQQTRVEAVIPYYERFLTRFPTAAAFAAASEAEVLAAWSGLGYYSRARNLQRAAAAAENEFPQTYDAIRALPGVGPYTAAAVASIGFDLPHAAVDGNVLRVLARVMGDSGDIGSPATRTRITETANALLDPRRPGDFNQATMELGATICLPRSPQCLLCPVNSECVARREGRQGDLPVKQRKTAPTAATTEVLIVESDGQILLGQRPRDARRMPGFWELPPPDAFPEITGPQRIGSFRHTIVNAAYEVTVFTGIPATIPATFQWFPPAGLAAIPLTTVTRKALALAGRHSAVLPSISRSAMGQ